MSFLPTIEIPACDTIAWATEELELAITVDLAPYDACRRHIVQNNVSQLLDTFQHQNLRIGAWLYAIDHINELFWDLGQKFGDVTGSKRFMSLHVDFVVRDLGNLNILVGSIGV